MGEETANVALDPNGDVTILIGTQSSGQGHQTAYAQLVAEQFGLPPERVHILQGDTDQHRDRPRYRRLGFDSDRRRQRPARHRRTRQEAEGDRGRSAGDQRRRSRNQRRQDTDRRHRPFDQLCRSGKASRRRSVETECKRDLHPGRRHLPERHASGRSRDRSRNRHHQDRQLRHRRRFRRDAQSAAAGRAGSRRRDAGHRPGVDGAGGL